MVCGIVVNLLPNLMHITYLHRIARVSSGNISEIPNAE